MEILSNLKSAYHRDRIYDFKRGALVSPVCVEIDPVAVCNHHCPFCRFHGFRENDFNENFSPTDMIPHDKITEILVDCKAMGVKAIQIVGGGEPSLHPDFVLMLHDIVDCDLEIGLVTNGVSKAWEHETVEIIELLSVHGQWVRFSLDAATQETYDKIHGGRWSDFTTALRSIEMATSLGNDRLTVGISFVVTHENVHEIGKAAELSAELGADYIRFAAFVPPDVALNVENDYYNDTFVSAIWHRLNEIPEHIPYADEFTRRHATDVVPQYDFGDQCYYSQLVASIGSDLNLYPCCVWKYHSDAVVGSLKDRSFREVWESQERTQFYERFDISEQCNSCYLKPKNDVIKYLTSEPQHVNFI